MMTLVPASYDIIVKALESTAELCAGLQKDSQSIVLPLGEVSDRGREIQLPLFQCHTVVVVRLFSCPVGHGLRAFVEPTALTKRRVSVTADLSVINAPCILQLCTKSVRCLVHMVVDDFHKGLPNVIQILELPSHRIVVQLLSSNEEEILSYALGHSQPHNGATRTISCHPTGQPPSHFAGQIIYRLFDCTHIPGDIVVSSIYWPRATPAAPRYELEHAIIEKTDAASTDLVSVNAVIEEMFRNSTCIRPPLTAPLE